MSDLRFADYMAQERTRLDDERNGLLLQESEIQQRLLVINREMQAVDAYEAAKAGKLPSTPRKKSAKSNGEARRPRITGRRAEILQAVTERPMTRSEVIDYFGVRGDKSGEMSISNALSALIKTQALTRDDVHRYVVA